MKFLVRSFLLSVLLAFPGGFARAQNHPPPRFKAVAFDYFVIFKPDPRAYELGMKELHLRREDILFAAFGGWDACGAKNFGYTTYWVNRFDLPPEQIGSRPDATSNDLEGLLSLVLGPSPAGGPYLKKGL